MDFKLEFDRNIISASSASMSLNNGSTAVYHSGLNSKTITMRYTVAEGDNSQVDLAHNATTSISPANVFTDDRGFEVNQTLPAITVITNNQQIDIDTDKPTINIGAPNITLGNSTATFTYVLTYADATSAIASATTTNADIEFNNPNNVTIGNTLVQTTGTSSSTISLWNITGDGELSLRIRENVIDDAAGNVNIATPYSTSITIDNTPPVVTFENVSPANVNSNTTSTFVFSTNGADNNNLLSNSFTLVYDETFNGTVNYVGGNLTSATVTVSGITGDGSASLTMLSGGYSDNAGNVNAAVTSTGINVDNTAPVVSNSMIFSNNANPAFAKLGDIVSLTFSTNENVETSSVAIAGINAVTLNNLGSNNYAATFTVDANANQGSSTFFVSVSDLVGNSTTFNTVDAGSMEIDNTAPTGTITVVNNATLNLSNSSLTVTVSYNEPMNTTANPNISIGAGATHTQVSQEWTTNTLFTRIYDVTENVEVNNIAVTLSPQVTDLAGNIETAAVQFNNTFSVDRIAPFVTFNQVNPSVVNSAGTATFTYNVTGANVNNVVNSADFNIELGAGVAGGNIGTVNAGLTSGTVTVNGLTGNGSASLTILAAKYADNAGNTSIAVTSGGVNVDNTAPIITNVSISTNNASGNRAKVGDLVSVTFTSNETLNGGSATIAGRAGLGINSIGGNNYSASISVIGTDNQGLVSFNIDVQDQAGNNANIHVVDDASAVTIDYTAPTGTVTVVNNSTLNLSNSSLTVTVTYDENMSNANNPNIAIGGGLTFNTSSAAWTSNTVFTGVYNITSNVEQNNVAVTLASNVATDLAGNLENNPNYTSNTFSVDRIAPTATIATNEPSPTGNQTISATLTFSEAVTGIAVNDVLNATNANATVSSVITAGTVYGVEITANSIGSVSVWLAANEANDNAGNPNASSNTLTYSYQAIEAFTKIELSNTGTSADVTMGSSNNRAFTLILTDDAGVGTENDGDELPTRFTGITVGKSGSYNFDDVISSATFFNSSNTSLATGTVNANNIVFNFAEQTINDGASATFYMSYSLKTSATFEIDNTELIFTANGSNMTTTGESTPFENTNNNTDAFNVNNVRVTASKLLFASQPQNHTLANGATFTVRALDAGDNLDKDFAGEIRIVSTIGKLSSQDSTLNATNGIASFSAYKFRTWASNTTIKAQATGLDEATSSAFSIRANAPDQATDLIRVSGSRTSINMKWKPSTSNGVYNKSILFVREINNNSYAFSNDIETSINSMTFNSDLSITATGTTYNDNQGGQGRVVFAGLGDINTNGELAITITGSGLRDKTFSFALYMFDGDPNDINTLSYNISQLNLVATNSKEAFEVETDKVSKNDLFSVGSINPNPVRDEFNMNLTLNEAMDVTVDLYSTVGQRIGTLYQSSSMNPGLNVINMNMSKFDVSQGTYMLQIKAGDEIMMVPFVFQK